MRMNDSLSPPSGQRTWSGWYLSTLPADVAAEVLRRRAIRKVRDPKPATSALPRDPAADWPACLSDLTTLSQASNVPPVTGDGRPMYEGSFRHILGRAFSREMLT